MRFQKMVLALSAGLLFISGCGGGGGGTTGGSGGAGSVGFYVGDDFGVNYSQVVMTLYHVDASVDGMRWQPVFDSSSGIPVNITALASTAQFMGGMSMPAGSYSVVRVTMSDHMKLVALNGAITNPPVAAPSGSSSGGKYTFRVNMPMMVSPGQTANMALDFDLANFQMKGGVLKLAVLKMDPGRFGGMRHEGWLHGTVSGLNPNVSFNLTMPMMSSVSVQVSSSTPVTSLSTGKAVTLADGQSIDVQGTVDPMTHAISATSIQVRDGGTGGPVDVGLRGSVVSVDAATASLVVSSAWTSNFSPKGASVAVKTNAQTNIGKGMMGTGSFADILAGQTVMVTGAYDASTDTVTANRIGIL